MAPVSRPRTEGYNPNRPLSQQIAVPRISLEDQIILARYQKRNTDRSGSVLGKFWNAPNTAIGLLHGAAGYVAGKVAGTNPKVSVGGNAIQFTNNPAGGMSAITLGNVAIYSPKPGSRPQDRQNGSTVQEHERQHTLQGELLGPLYIPSNIAGGLYALAKDKKWHGPSNWNEVGPLRDPPTPWAR